MQGAASKYVNGAQVINAASVDAVSEIVDKALASR